MRIGDQSHENAQFQRRQLTVVRCEELIQWLKNPKVKDGDRIKLADVDDITHLDRALDANGKKRLPKIENYKRKLAEQSEIAAIEFITVDELLSHQTLPNKSEETGSIDDVEFNDFILEDL